MLGRNPDWNITFTRLTELQALDEAEHMHILLTDQKTVTCLELEYEVFPIATMGTLKQDLEDRGWFGVCVRACGV